MMSSKKKGHALILARKLYQAIGSLLRNLKTEGRIRVAGDRKAARWHIASGLG
jgi:hypothetical protein